MTFMVLSSLISLEDLGHLDNRYVAD